MTAVLPAMAAGATAVPASQRRLRAPRTDHTGRNKSPFVVIDQRRPLYSQPESNLMYNYPADAPAIDILGALGAPAHDGIVRPRRLPEKYRDQIPTTFMRVMVDAAAGVRIRFATAATSITLRLRAFPIVFTGPSPRSISFVDLTIDGHLVTSQPVHGAPCPPRYRHRLGRHGAALEEAVEFSHLEARMKIIELWLPA